MPCVGCERRKAKLKALADRAARAMGLKPPAPARERCVCGHLKVLHVSRVKYVVDGSRDLGITARFRCMSAEPCDCTEYRPNGY